MSCVTFFCEYRLTASNVKDGGMSVVGAIIHYTLVPYHMSTQGVMNYGPYILYISGPYTSSFMNNKRRLDTIDGYNDIVQEEICYV